MKQGLLATALHGGRSQSEREAALRDFRCGPTSILVCKGPLTFVEFGYCLMDNR